MYANTDVYNHPLFRSFKNTQDKEPSSNTDEGIKIIVASNFITEPARRPAVRFNTVMTIIAFCTYRHDCWQCTNHGCKLLRTTFQMCLIHWTHGHSTTVVVFDSNDLSWLSLEVPLWFIGRVSYYYYYYTLLQTGNQPISSNYVVVSKIWTCMILLFHMNSRGADVLVDGGCHHQEITRQVYPSCLRLRQLLHLHQHFDLSVDKILEMIHFRYVFWPLISYTYFSSVNDVSIWNSQESNLTSLFP